MEITCHSLLLCGSAWLLGVLLACGSAWLLSGGLLGCGLLTGGPAWLLGGGGLLATGGPSALLGGSGGGGGLGLGQLERSSGASSLDLLQGALGDALPQGQLEADASGGLSYLVVGEDVLEDSLTGGAVALLQGVEGGGDHDAVLGVGGLGGRLLGLLGGSFGSHGSEMWFGWRKRVDVHTLGSKGK